MSSLLKKIGVTLLCLISINLYADSTKTISFENQREEEFILESILKQTFYKTETVDSTCYRDQSSQENVCHMETRYRQECSTVPAHQECQNTYERECRNETTYENICQTIPGREMCEMVTHYRQECNEEGGRERQCRTIPGDIRCRVINGENRCEKIPPREECNEGQRGNRVCRQVAYQERECHQGPSRSECHTEPRTHQECRNVPRQVCDWIPAHNVCQSIPYQEQVCGMETVTRKVAYACKKDIQVPYEKIVKTNTAKVQVTFEAPTFSPKANFNFNLDENGNMKLDADSLSSLKHFIILKKDISNKDQGEINDISAHYNIHFVNLESEVTATSNGISNLSLHSDSVSFIVNGKFDQSRSTLNLNISKKGDTKFNGALKAGQFKSNFDGNQTQVSIDLRSLGAPKLGGIINRHHQVNISIMIDYSNLGEVIAPKESKFTISNSFNVKVE